MLAYIVRRILLMIPTLFGIMVINFIIIQVAPGGPVEQIIAELRGTAVDPTQRFSGGGGESASGQQQQSQQTGSNATSRYRGAQGLDPEIIAQIEKQFGFDKPLHVRFFNMLRGYIVFDFGESLFSGRRVVDLVIEKMPVSISLGLWTTLLTYLISIPLGIAKATRDGSRFDVWTSAVRRRQLLPMVPSARDRFGQLAGSRLARTHRRLFLAHDVAIVGPPYRQLRRVDHAYQEFLP